MDTLARIVGFGCIFLAGVAVPNSGSPANTGRAVGPPVLPADNVSPSPPPPRLASAPPSCAVVEGPRGISFSADSDGRFLIAGYANGTANRITLFVVADTGATDGLVIDRRDARRLGIDVNRLTFDGTARTANGVVRMADARIARLEIGPFIFTDVPVSINDAELEHGLLGMGLLRKLNVTIRNDTLTLSNGP